MGLRRTDPDAPAAANLQARPDGAVAAPHDHASVVPPRQPGLAILIGLTAASSLSMNLFLPSLPGMARDFGVSYATMQLSVSAYLAASAVVQFAVGPISDRLGRRPVMLGALVIFVLATLGCLLAPTAGLFLLCRMGQSAISAGMVLPRTVIRDIAPRDRAASMIGYVMTGMSIVPMIAPAIGGLLDAGFGWRASFVLLALMGVAVLAWTWARLPETAAPGGLGFRAQMAATPALLRSGRYWGYVLAATFASGVFYGYLGGAPFVGTAVFHMAPSTLGWWFMAPSIGYLAGNFAAGRWSGHVGLDRMVVLGCVITVLGMAVPLAMVLGGATSPLVFFGGMAVSSIGNGMSLPNANAGMMNVRPEIAGTAAGLGAALMIAGGAGLAMVAGALMVPGAGAGVLLGLLTASAAASLASAMLVLRR